MPRACGASSTPCRLWESRRLRLLDHPLSRMMTAVAIGTPLGWPASPAHSNLSPPTVANSAAHHMMDIMQMYRSPAARKIEEHPPWPQLPIPSSSFPQQEPRLAGLWVIFPFPPRIRHVHM